MTRAIRNSFIGFVLTLGLSIGVSAYSHASGVESGAESERIVLSLGSEDNHKRLFHPDGLIFEAGKRYTLVIENPSNELHEFDSPGLAGASWSSQVKVLDGYGGTALPVAIVVGTPDEIVVSAGGTVEWSFVPVETGSYEMICDVLDQDGKTHTEKGMRGVIVVK